VNYVDLLCRFASIAKLAGEQLGPYIAKLVPKLYRYQYDPNARVRDSMSHIWRALVAEPKKTVDEHFGAILQELLKVPSSTSASMLSCIHCTTDMHAKMLSDVESGVCCFEKCSSDVLAFSYYASYNSRGSIALFLHTPTMKISFTHL